MNLYNRTTDVITEEDFRYTNEYVSTPNGTDISVYSYIDELPSWYIQQENNWYSSLYNSAEFVSTATLFYNCHSYAWYSQNTNSNNAWMDFPTLYYSTNDSSYIEITGAPIVGDIICYYNAYGTNIHSGIITDIYNGVSNNVCEDANLYEVKSKWGALGLFSHIGDQCPYTAYVPDYQEFPTYLKPYYFASEVRYYRTRTNASYTLSNFSGSVSELLTITSNTATVDRYAMYELNVNYSKYYEFNVSSTSSLDVRLYDEHMQLISVNDMDSNKGP